MLEVSITKSLETMTLTSSFSVQNEILGVLGPSGCGKSMTLRCIAGLQTPTTGKIILNNKTLYDSKTNTSIPPRLRNIGYVFQNYALFPHLTVAQNIGYGIRQLNKTEQNRAIHDMIERMKLDGLENRYPKQLSGGQQQRAALARTLITKPELLLLDEPFSALDSHVKSQLEHELLHIIKNSYTGTILLVTHDLQEAYKLCDRILMFSNGKTVQIGKKDDILNHPVNLTAARITGCKNLFPVEVGHERGSNVFVRTNKFELKVKNQKDCIYKSRMIAGVRAHHIQLHPTNRGGINTFPCEVISYVESAFSTTVRVQCKGQRFQVEIAKKDWRRLIGSNNTTLYLHIPPEHIFLVPYEESDWSTNEVIL
ncbi:sulfate/molybdate ABC transporter ATP-binding protein [Aneurinibacillus terranovensis]|uniref:sulfate/molybdate ABC transporter ATP-binding protein n=1 Tax=Aneurinibacillus terranovensis TaxID=278991 RepID=UPI0003F64BD5|nr:sulfate/molybdate ABC transporter ATP-binding protein [Aneurinibacillus terranovensis]